MANRRVHLDGVMAPSAAERLSDQLSRVDTVRIGAVEVTLDPGARTALGQILDHLAAGTPVEVTPVTEWLSTSEAAAVLQVSRPTLVHMLESGLIAFDRPGVHRRVSRSAIDAYLASRGKQRRQALNELAGAEDPSVVDEFVKTR